MKNMINFYIIFTLLIFGVSCNKKSTPTTAETTATSMNQSSEERRGPRGDGNRTGDRDAQRAARNAEMMAQLNLSDAQKTKYEEIQNRYQNKMMAMRQSGNGDREAMRDNMMKMRTEMTGEIKKILTADQFATYQKIESERKDRRGPGGGGPGRGRNN